MTDLKRNLIDGCAQVDSGNQQVEVDTGYIVESLLLFDRYILDSVRLKELPTLVKLFGVEGLNHLFDTGALKIFCKSLTIGQTGQTGVLESRRKKGVLPKGCYSFTAIDVPNKRHYIDTCIQVIENVSFLNKREKNKLKSMVYDNLLYYPEEAGKKILKQLKNDIKTDKMAPFLES